MSRVAWNHVIGYVLLAAVCLLAGLAVGRATAPICHSATEDSQILDCDYRNGGWHP